MLNKFREKHILSIFNMYEGKSFPLDKLLNQCFRSNKSIGSKDRRVIGDIIYDIIRYRNFLDHFSTKPYSFEKRFIEYQKNHSKKNLPIHLQHGFPEELFNLLTTSYGDKTIKICEISNARAPLTIRVNPLKTTREQLINKLDNAIPCKQSMLGIQFKKPLNLLGLSEFKNGLFEIQDEGSQVISELIHPSPDNLVLDFCAGSGGKTLAFAHKMSKNGIIYLYDNRQFMLKRAEKRLIRAGITNFQIIENKKQLYKLKSKMDWIALDVPCSGTGTLRRNPDLKWKFSTKKLQLTINQQKSIFKQAIDFLKPNGKIVYATCSLLKEENEEQIKYFTEEYNLKQLSQIKILPEKNGPDGFFAALLENLESTKLTP